MSQIGRFTTLSMPHAVTLDVRIVSNPGGQDTLHEGVLQNPLKYLMKRTTKFSKCSTSKPKIFMQPLSMSNSRLAELEIQPHHSIVEVQNFAQKWAPKPAPEKILESLGLPA